MRAVRLAHSGDRDGSEGYRLIKGWPVTLAFGLITRGGSGEGGRGRREGGREGGREGTIISTFFAFSPYLCHLHQLARHQHNLKRQHN